ncbi:MAG TPA: hypothetical protein DCY88_29005 [Cyanobacteria bacterium UBA11372]|nr:hypothetical protein [Cyanobacteria bacterium UBA11372]
MAFTDNSDLYGAIHEEGINLVVRHLMSQRPSVFNYATAQVAENQQLWCAKINVAPGVTDKYYTDKYGKNPIFTIEKPLPVLGTNGAVGMNFCFHLVQAQIDFHPGNILTLPPELNPPLAEQHFAANIRVCGGLGCPSKETLDNVQIPTGDQPPIILPAQQLACFCLDLFVVGHVEITTNLAGKQQLKTKVDGLEIVDMQPEGLENSCECYLNTLVQLVILPRVSVAVEKLTFEILKGLPKIVLSASTKVPNNPAIEDNQLKVFIEVEVLP